MKSLRNKSAFTLIEIIISLTLIGIALVFLLKAYHLTIKHNIESSKYYEALLFIKEKIEEVETDGLKNLSQAEGQVNKNGTTFYWKIYTAPFENDLAKVTAGVSWKENKKQENIEITTLLPYT